MLCDFMAHNNYQGPLAPGLNFVKNSLTYFYSVFISSSALHLIAEYFTLLISMLPIVWAKCRNLTSGSIGFENSESEPIERNCRFDHLSAEHFRLEDSAPEPIQRSVFATPFRPYKGKESDQ